MAGKRGRKKPESRKIVKEDEVTKAVEESGVENTSDAPVAHSISESELARTHLRERWELASVLNFLQVYKPVIQSKLVLSMEEIETALIRPNDDLSELHISLLKGIPPVNKNLNTPDAWVAILQKKLVPWWPWVAEGEIPIAERHGEELSRYKELDPIKRLLILKALCELRAIQDDAISYINDALKQGTEICTFRKDRIGGNDSGMAYWIDGDEVTGYRLYREIIKVEVTPRKGKGRLTQPPSNYQWETLATNVDEFRQISDKFSSSDIVEEAEIAEIIKSETIPALERMEKKKERALKRQQKQVMLLNGYLNSYQLGGTRSCRNRKPVSYTFDEYDRTIDEAIQLNKKRKKNQEPKRGQEGGKESNANGNALDNGATDHDTDDGDGDDDDDEKFRGDGNTDSGDQDYGSRSDETGDGDDDNDNNDENSDNYSNGDLASSEKDNNGRATRASRRSQKTNAHSKSDVGSLRRSKRITGTENHVKKQKQKSQSADSVSATNSYSDEGSSAGSDSVTKSEPYEEGSSADDDSVSKSESGNRNLSADTDSVDKSESDDESSSKASTGKDSDAEKGLSDALDESQEESEETDGDE